MSTEETSVLIIGAGPVGLFLAYRLKQLGIDHIIVEKRKTLSQETRSIGIHPPSLEMLQVMDLAEPFIHAGFRVQRGHAFARGKTLGTVDFSAMKPPYNFILTLSQGRTMQLLATPNIRFGVEEKEWGRDARGILLETPGHRYRARWLAACEGGQSATRRQLDIPRVGGPYPDHYFMGDFAESTKLGNDAGIFLEPEGLVESFPLRGNQRRWVARCSTDTHASLDGLVATIAKRTGHELDATQNTMFRSFGVERYRAIQSYADRCFLVGDAAHITSPIGGQGMNLGWMDAWDLAEVFAGRQTPEAYNRSVQRRARQVIRRAEFNMILGRPSRMPGLKELLVRGLLNSPVRPMLARRFTMRGLRVYNPPPPG